jgi:hypothetical protein
MGGGTWHQTNVNVEMHHYTTFLSQTICQVAVKCSSYFQTNVEMRLRATFIVLHLFRSQFDTLFSSNFYNPTPYQSLRKTYFRPKSPITIPKLPVYKWGFSIFPKDSPYLDARQAEESDTEGLLVAV